MDSNGVQLEVRDAPHAGRYELVRDGVVVGYASYRLMEGRVVVPHVEVDRSVEGQGMGGRLVQGVLEDLRQRQLKITPLCGFAASWIRRHPEYRDMVA
jgi:uncharacterized protein